MSAMADWQASNAKYLSLALSWLRGKLERHASRGEGPAPVAAPEPELSVPEPRPETAPPPKRGKGRREPAAQTSATESQVLPPLDSLAKIATEMAALASKGPAPPALVSLCSRLGLSNFERDVLLLCAAMELDTTVPLLCARAQDDLTRPYPTFALALPLFDEPAWDALSPERPLRYWRLIEINQPGGHPLTSSPLRADERIVSYLKGLNYLDDRLAPLFSPLEASSAASDLPPSQRAAVEVIASRLKQCAAGENPPIVQLLGIDPSSKQLVAVAAAALLGVHVYRIPAALLPANAPELETLSRLWQRECTLLPLALYLEGVTLDAEAPNPGIHSPLNRFLSRTGGIIFVDTRDVLPGLAENTLRVDIAKPTAPEQKDVWAAVLGETAGETPARLAGQFNLNLAAINQIANTVAAQASPTDTYIHDKLWAACLASTRPRLDTLAQRVDARATWDDIVLPPVETALLHQIAAQVGHRSKVHEGWGFARKMNRGLGISALFAGDSGCGKTMAAEVIANDLRLNLYRIDLSAVVSKYIGETEKNLRRLFDAAEDGGAILFFDEADALFGKRSEVKDSHDRYANIEINYLLQRMEAYGGLAILATNRQSALDPAFMRRLRFVVNFSHPGIDQRRAMWQKVFPEEAPVHELDLDRLARLNLTGGNISSIALNAAFQAADSKLPLTMELVMNAARTELRKLGRVINELEFRAVGKAGKVA